MSGGKKTRTKKRTFSEAEMRRAVKRAADEATSRILLLCLVAARDEFSMDEKEVVTFMERMERYVDAEAKGLISMDVASDSLKKRTGIDLRVKNDKK